LKEAVQESPALSQQGKKNDAHLSDYSVEELARLSIQNKLDALIAYFEKHGFDASVALLAAFNGDQEIYQATKMLALLAAQREPKAVFSYLAKNDAFLLSDEDVMLSLMSASPELFPIEIITEYAKMMPAGGSRFQAYNYLSQIMADPANLAKIPAIMATIQDRGVLSYLERSLPRALLNANPLPEAIRQIEALEKYGEFTNRNDFVDAGAKLAEKHEYTLAGLSEIETLGGEKTSALFQGYIEAMVSKGLHTNELLDYTLQRYKNRLDDGSLLAIVFKRALARDPETTFATLKQAGMESSELDALVTRNFINFSQNHPIKAFEYIDSQSDPLVKDNLLAIYGQTQNYSDVKSMSELGERIADPQVKRAYLLDSTVKLSSQNPHAVFDLIMGYESSTMKNDLLKVNLPFIAAENIELGIRMAQAMTDQKARTAALYSLIASAGKNEDHIDRIHRLIGEELSE
jgi:hypothetical protein